MTPRTSRALIRTPLIALSVCLAALAVETPAMAMDQFANKSGNWTDPSTWKSGQVPASTDTVAIVGNYNVTIPVGKTVAHSGVILVVDGALIINGTFKNAGTLRLSCASISSQNNGTLENAGTVQVWAGRFINAGKLNNTNSVVVTAWTALENTKTGVLTNAEKIEVFADFVSAGVVSNTKQFIVSGSALNQGTFTNAATGSLVITQKIRNEGTLVNLGTVTHQGSLDGRFENAGKLDNKGMLKVGDARLLNEIPGTITNANGATLEALASFNNLGVVSNAGKFSFASAVGARPVFTMDGGGKTTNEATGVFEIAGNIGGYGPFVNLGTLTVLDLGSNYQEGFWVRYTFENSGTINLRFLMRVEPTGTLTNTRGGTINVANSTLVNRGKIANYGTITTGTCERCLVANIATLTNYCDAKVGKVESNAPTQVACTATTPAPGTASSQSTVDASLLGTSLCSNVQGTTLKSGSVMQPSTMFTSPNKQYQLAYQSDGNLVVYEVATKKALWASNTPGTAPLKVAMQTDGNVVITKANNTVAWSSRTHGNASAVLSLQDDGNLVVYQNCVRLWSRM